MLEYLRTFNKLMNRPIPKAVWFIDRPRHYYEIKEFLLKKEVPVHTPISFYSSSLFGLPLYNWSSDEIKEKPDKFFPFKSPGIWVEMTRGEHIKVIDW